MENENKYILLEDVINSKYEDFNDRLKQQGYYAIDGNSFSVTYEHETNKSEIRIITNTSNEIYVDFFNSNKVTYSAYTKFSFVPCSWCLGTKENFEIEDIFEILNNEEFKKFVLLDKDSINNFSNIRIHKGSDGWKIKSLDEFLSQNNQEQQTQTQKQIENICKAISDVLIDKNKKYGNSALKPINVFFKGDNTNSILIRLDDKLSRIKNNKEDIRVNDICDTIGYLVLLLVIKGVKIEDIEKLKD